MKTDFTNLVPEITRWNNGHGVSISDWIQMMGDYARAVGYSVVFWPSFIEKDGCVFRADVTNESQCFKSCNGDRQEIELLKDKMPIKKITFRSSSMNAATKTFM